MGRKKQNRREALASMNSGNFRIDRVPSTQREIDYAEHRFMTMKLGQLESRIKRMADPIKLIATIRVATALRMLKLSRTARQRLNAVLDAQ